MPDMSVFTMSFGAHSSPLGVPASPAPVPSHQLCDALSLCSPLAPENLQSIVSCGETLILDVRSEAAFLQSHLSGALPLTLPTVLWKRFLKQRHVSGSLSRCLLAEALAPLKNIAKDTLLVMYDQHSSTLTELPDEHPLRVFAEYFANEKLSVLFVEGGFEAVKKFDPFLIEIPATPAFQNPFVLEPPVSRKRSTPSAELSFIHGFLAVGSEKHAQDVSLLKSEGVTHILNLTCTDATPEARKQFRVCRIELKDSLTENLLAHLQAALEFIDDARQAQGKILVHCYAGISRSVSVCVAYAMWSFDLALEEALHLVKSHRECASPNLNFIGQLMLFEKTLRARVPSSLSPQASSPASLAAVDSDGAESTGSASPPPTHSLHVACQNALASMMTPLAVQG